MRADPIPSPLRLPKYGSGAVNPYYELPGIQQDSSSEFSPGMVAAMLFPIILVTACVGGDPAGAKSIAARS